MITEPENKITYFARTNYRNQNKKFGIKRNDRRHHMYLLGKTGMGKTTLMETMIASDIEHGEGLAVIDPHGDLIAHVLELIPSHRINDVIYINPADTKYPVALNIFDQKRGENRSLIVSGILSVFKKLYSEFWGPRMEHVFRNALLTIVNIPGANLFTFIKLLTDFNTRKQIVENINDQVIKDFWENEFDSWDKRQRMDVISPILNKVGQFLSDPIIRNIVCQKQNKIDFQEVINKKKIVLVNLAIGNIGEDNAMLLGSLILTKLQLTAMSFTTIPEQKRADFYVYVDECHNFFTESFASMLAEMRKYHLNLIIANQYLEQLQEKVRSAILGNVGTLICFRLGPQDVEILKEEFFPRFSKQDFLNLPKYQIYLRLMIEGVVSEGFSANTLAPGKKTYMNDKKIVAQSRQRYSMQV